MQIIEHVIQFNVLEMPTFNKKQKANVSSMFCYKLERNAYFQ